jgi:phosphate transport system permease protein
MTQQTTGGRAAVERLGVAGPRLKKVRAAALARSRRIFADRMAKLLVTSGGVAIIASILSILLFIVAEVLPLLFDARVEPAGEVTLPASRVGAMIVDPHRTLAATLGEDGVLRVVRLDDGRIVAEREVIDAKGQGAVLSQVEALAGDDGFTAKLAGGRIVIVPIGWTVEFSGDQRVVRPDLRDAAVTDVDGAGGALGAYAVSLGDDGRRTIAAQLAGGSLVLLREEERKNEFSGEVERSQERKVTGGPGQLAHLVLDGRQRNLFGADAGGRLYWWPLADGWPEKPQVIGVGAPVTAMTLLIGGRSLVIGQADGSLSVWFVVRGGGGGTVLKRIRDFPAHSAAIRLIEPSRRDKGFSAWDESGLMGLYYSTSHRVLWRGATPVPSVQALSYSPKADALYLATPGRLLAFDVSNPHPEVSWKALFGRVWYEGYEKPEYVWQSSSGNDDFEPKLSLTPLLVGTLKGTLYSLLIAIPLGVFGAMYTSQFMHPSLKRLVKPAVEIMAALPSVVLGFLAGLWLAPKVEHAFPALLAMLVALPILTLLAGAAWQAIPNRWRGRVPAGSEALLFVVVLGAGAWLCLALGRPIENLFFGGSFQAWLLGMTGLPYDQRNAVIVGLAMGFAVIPIIFAISEDAFSNVPRDLVSGSLALGANRWQTVTRVVLPTASPGIFSAIMVGFGRAVGETMIVLMATGNTPIMDWNPFNGFRTLSANIAVEIPEAPQFGSLYRVLFLAALLLFVVTFLVNTAAELVRQRLRRRYAQL